MFGKTGKFPFSWIDLRSIFFQVLPTFPSVMVFSLRHKTCDHFSTEQGYFFNVSGMLDWVTGENSKRLRKQQLRSSPLLSLTLRSATAQGTPGHSRARVHIRAPQALRAQAPVGKRQKPRIS
jgi:hypothetical protein